MQRNVSDFGVFTIVEILKDLSQKGFEKKAYRSICNKAAHGAKCAGEPEGWCEGIVK